MIEKLITSVATIIQMRGRLQDIAGKRFGRLIAMWPVGYGKHKHAYWMCSCDCGGYAVARGSHLKEGSTASCRCIQAEVRSASHTIHGMWNTREYRTYQIAKDRCTNPNNPSYAHYGARGIEFRFGSFQDFFAALGRRPSPQHSIDRIDNDGNYEAGNVRWATIDVQRRNRPDFINALPINVRRLKYTRNARALRADLPDHFTPQEWESLTEKYGHICLCCGEKKPLTPDHVIPLRDGGKDTIDNIQPLCGSCNSRKWRRATDYRLKYSAA